MIPGTTHTMHVTSGAYIHWSCAHCHGWHRYRVPEMEITTRALSEEVITGDGRILAMGTPDFEVTVQISDPTDLNCSRVSPEPDPRPLSSILGTDLLRRIYLAIEYTVLDPEERAALVKAIQKEVT